MREIVIIMTMIIGMIWFSDCCFESEKIGLLQLKQMYSSSRKSYISDWGSDGDCCSWSRVECNSTTGHVTRLDVSSIRDYVWDSSEGWYLNASLFLPFPHLYQLDLSSNGIVGCIENEGFERLSTLVNLEILDLSFNNLNNSTSILQSLGVLPSLKSLNLGSNRLNGIGVERLSSTLPNLEILDLSLNNLNNITSILQSLGVLPSLKSLYLTHNGLNGTINISDLNGLPNLQELDLSFNEITEFIVSKDSRVPSNLRTLYLDYMRATIDGISTLNLQSLSKLPNIKTLSLRENHFQGQIFHQGSVFESLEHLYLNNSVVENINILQSVGIMRSLKTLSLKACGLGGNIPTSQGMCLLEHLQELDLSLNDLTGNLPWCLANFTSLQKLDLYRNQFTGTMSLFLFQSLTSLQYLDLSFNQFNGNISSLQSLTSLQYLDLSYNLFNGKISSLHSLTSLQYLDISDNLFNGNISSLHSLTSLQYLDISDNLFNGNISSLHSLTSLQYLDLSFNLFNGKISSLHSLTSLQYLYLSYNQFNGKISSLHSLTSLQYLYLSHNLFQIPISLTPLFNLSQLHFLDVDNNLIYADVEDHNLNPKFQLEYISLNGYGDVGAIPKFLYHQHNLHRVVISNIKLRGMFPYWLLENNTSLDTLDLSNNSLSEPLLLPNKPHLNLRDLDISDNYFNGYIPSQFGLFFPRLTSLEMSRNEFKGSIPDTLCNINDLHFLDMSQNNISGTIPKCIGNMSQLGVLDLSNNNISGSLPSNFSSFIGVVKISKNRLQGSLKHAFYYCSSLIMLDLSHNNLSGSIPSWIERLSQLSFLDLGHNNLQGQIPIELCKVEQLSFLDISHNRISGHLLSCLNFTTYFTRDSYGSSGLQSLELTMKGNTYSYEPHGVLGYMTGIDTSCNNLTGQIPVEIGELENIKVLNFSHNSLIGRIPPTFSNLKEIESLDLSHNNLQGSIPHQLTQLTSIEVFNVSYNNLSGPTPDKVKQFGTFDESSYKGNPFLCGWPLSKSCNVVDSSSSSAHNEESSINSLIDMEAFYWSFGVAYGMVLISIVAILCINPHWRRVWFHYVQISIDNSYYFIIDNIPCLSGFKFPKFCRRIYSCVRD